MHRIVGRSAQTIPLAWIAVVGIYFLWGSTYIGIRYAVETIPPFVMAGRRYSPARLILLSFYFAFRRSIPRVTRRQLLATGIAGGALLLGGNGLLSLGEQH